MQAMHTLFAQFDVIVAPTFGAQLTATNLCGQPAVIVPIGLRGAVAPAYAPTDATPGPATAAREPRCPSRFWARCLGDAAPLELAGAFSRSVPVLHPAL